MEFGRQHEEVREARGERRVTVKGQHVVFRQRLQRYAAIDEGRQRGGLAGEDDIGLLRLDALDMDAVRIDAGKILVLAEAQANGELGVADAGSGDYRAA